MSRRVFLFLVSGVCAMVMLTASWGSPASAFCGGPCPEDTTTTTTVSTPPPPPPPGSGTTTTSATVAPPGEPTTTRAGVVPTTASRGPSPPPRGLPATGIGFNIVLLAIAVVASGVTLAYVLGRRRPTP